MDNRDLTENEDKELHEEWERLGKPGPDNKGKHKLKQKGFADPGVFQILMPWWLTPSPLACSDLYCPEEGGNICTPKE